MSDDRTFCSNMYCEHKECDLHIRNARDIWRNKSVADYENTEYCKKLAEMKGGGENADSNNKR